MTHDPFEADLLRGRLSELSREPVHEWHDRSDLQISGLQRSAVLMALTEADGAFELVFTHRSQDLEQHSGEVSFPGGREETGDNTLVETALREAYEEIGLPPSEVEVFGAFTEMPTVTGFRVRAFVGEFPHPYDLIADSGEIESIFRAPLEKLADPEIHSVREREFNGTVYPVHYFEYGDHTIWGATGWLLNAFLDYYDLIESTRSRREGEE